MVAAVIDASATLLTAAERSFDGILCKSDVLKKTVKPVKDVDMMAKSSPTKVSKDMAAKPAATEVGEEPALRFEGDRNLIFHPMVYKKVYQRWLNDELACETEAWRNNVIFNWGPVSLMAAYLCYTLPWDVLIVNLIGMQLVQTAVFLSSHIQLHVHFLQGTQCNVVGNPYGYFHHYTDSRMYSETVYRYMTLSPFVVPIVMMLMAAGMRPETMVFWRIMADIDGQTHQWYHCNWNNFFAKSWNPINWALQHKSLKYWVGFLAKIGMINKHQHGEQHHKDRANNMHLTYNWVDVHYPLVSAIEEASVDYMWGQYKAYLKQTRGTHYPVGLQDLFSVVGQKKVGMTEKQEKEILGKHYEVMERRYGVVSEFLWKDFPDMKTMEKFSAKKYDVKEFKKESNRWIMYCQIPVTFIVIFCMLRAMDMVLCYLGSYHVTALSFNNDFSIIGSVAGLIYSDMSMAQIVDNIVSGCTTDNFLCLFKDARVIMMALSLCVSYTGLEGAFVPYIDLKDTKGIDTDEDLACFTHAEKWPARLWRKAPSAYATKKDQ